MQNLAMETANINNSHVILANDPDADRLAIAGKQEEGSGRCSTGRRSELCWEVIQVLLECWTLTSEEDKYNIII